MSKPVIITADSTVDLSPELLNRYHIHTIPLTINLGDDSFPDDESFTSFVMYERYRLDGTLPKTSVPSLQAFMDFFSLFTEKGFDIVHLDISAELSSAYNVAQMAARELSGVYVIDSRMLSTGIGLLAVEAAECRDRGMCAAEIAEHLNELKEKVSLEEMSYRTGDGGRAASRGAQAPSAVQDAIEGLVQLGYSLQEAGKAVRSVEQGDTMDSGALLKAALKTFRL